MGMRIIYGNVNHDGTKHSGTADFDCHKTGDGHYTLTFRPKFLGVPTVVLTQCYRDWTDFGYPGGRTTDNAVLIAVDESSCKYETGDGWGNRTNRNCAFIAIGDGSGPSTDEPSGG